MSQRNKYSLIEFQLLHIFFANITAERVERTHYKLLIMDWQKEHRNKTSYIFPNHS